MAVCSWSLPASDSGSESKEGVQDVDSDVENLWKHMQTPERPTIGGEMSPTGVPWQLSDSDSGSDDAAGHIDKKMRRLSESRAPENSPDRSDSEMDDEKASTALFMLRL